MNEMKMWKGSTLYGELKQRYTPRQTSAEATQVTVITRLGRSSTMTGERDRDMKNLTKHIGNSKGVTADEVNKQEE